MIRESGPEGIDRGCGAESARPKNLFKKRSALKSTLVAPLLFQLDPHLSGAHDATNMLCRLSPLFCLALLFFVAHCPSPTLSLAAEPYTADIFPTSKCAENDSCEDLPTFLAPSIESHLPLGATSSANDILPTRDSPEELIENSSRKEALFLPFNDRNLGKVLPVPYLNQRWDTEDRFGGSWACGAASTVMALAFFKKLPPRPINCSLPSPHTSEYGWYVSNVYTSPTGAVFDHCQLDSNGNKAFGAWAACTEKGGAWAHLIQEYVAKHGLIAEFHAQANLSLVQRAIDEGNVVLLSTQLSPHGHLILARGYTLDYGIVANDPWGNAALPNWPPNGNGVKYSWNFLRPRYCLLVRLPASSDEISLLPLPETHFSPIKPTNC